MNFLGVYAWVIAAIIIVIAGIAGRKIILRLFGILMIPEDQIGIVNKKFVLFGEKKTLPDGAIVALHGEAGLQADTLAPGIHFWLWPWQYEVSVAEFITIRSGTVGTVVSKDGKPLSDGHVLAKKVECDSFQNARAFLINGGERGPQITIIPPGSYRINTEVFAVEMVAVLEIQENKIGIVTTKEGKPLPTGDIAGKEISGHNMFQDAQVFIDNGGHKGMQEQVILPGRYYINPRFATVEIKDMTEVPIASVGVIIAYVGQAGADVTGDGFRHGNLVSKGERGVWNDPLDPGKYPINPYTHKIELVPTANVVLNWATGKTESHKLDEKLSTIAVRSFDGFAFNIDVSQIIHVPRNDAPKVIARFGSMGSLVTQVLEPTIGNYFRNAAQNSDVIDFLKKRSERQEEARQSIRQALEDYNINAVNTLIGDINPPEELMKTLTDRKIAEQEKITFERQCTAQEERQKLEQATALANTQARVVDSERQVTIAGFQADAYIKKAEGDAKSKTINAKADAEVKTTIADADAKVLMMVGDAEGKKITAVGIAEAEVIRKKTEAMDQSNYAVVEVAKALATNNIKLVPEIIVNGAGSNGNGGGTLVDVLLANMLRDQNTVKAVGDTQRSKGVE